MSWFARQVEEDVTVPNVGLHAVERIVALTKVRHLVHVRRAEEPAVEPIGPRVIRALNAAGECPCRFGAQARAAVPADVVEGVNVPVGRRRHDDAVAVDLSQHVLTGPCDLFHTTGAEPHRSKQGLEFTTEVRPVGVEARRQRARTFRHDVARLGDDSRFGARVVGLHEMS